MLFDATAGGSSEDAGWLLYNVGWYLAARGEVEFARKCFTRSVEWTERNLGPDHPDLIWHLQGLSTFSENPRPLRERMLALGLKAHGLEHEWTATLYQELARAQCQEGDDVGAQASCEQALAIIEQALGADSEEAGWAHAHLAYLAVRLGDLPGARTEAERATAAFDKVFDVPDPERQLTKNPARGWGHFVLAYVSGQQGDFTGERDHLARALAVWERVFGPEHDRPVMCLSVIGSFSKPAFGDLPGARDCLERALALSQQKGPGPDHPWGFGTVTNLARVMQFLGDPAAAKPLAEQALVIVETALRRAQRAGLAALQAFTPADFNLALVTQRAFARTAHDLLASVLLDMGDLVAAESHLEKALLITKDVMFGEWSGPDYEGVAEVLPTLARLRRLQGRLEESKACLEQSLATPEHAGPPHQWRMAATHLEYGLTLQEMGDLAGAKEHLEQAVSLFAFRLGPRHPRTEQARQCLAALEAEGATPKRRGASRSSRAR
jgi:tetratricopeptide (TPR) repeat protein